jgi:hypothetical protein
MMEEGNAQCTVAGEGLAGSYCEDDGLSVAYASYSEHSLCEIVCWLDNIDRNCPNGLFRCGLHVGMKQL